MKWRQRWRDPESGRSGRSVPPRSGLNGGWNRRMLPARPPGKPLWNLLRRLTAAGHEALFAGGCVRDRLLGLEPKDHDIATSAVPTHVTGLFPGANELGSHFGVVIAKHGGHRC